MKERFFQQTVLCCSSVYWWFILARQRAAQIIYVVLVGVAISSTCPGLSRQTNALVCTHTLSV